MIRKLVLLTMAVTFILPITGYSATYYISSLSGSDTNDGISMATPWQSIDKVNETIFADNSIILFKRGDIFRGGINTLKFPKGLTFGAYGEGTNPIIAGSVQITGWVPTSHPNLNPQVYEADVTALPLTDLGIEHLFVNKELMTIARYPNVDSPADKNWLKVGANAGKGAFTDPQLKAYGKPNHYWKGATLRIRNYSWTYTVKEITGYQAASGKITAKGLGKQLPEWGYFLDNKLTELDHPGEWYYDAEHQKVYFYPLTGGDPNTLLIEGSTYQVGISIGNQENNTIIENLSFRHFTKKGAHIGGSDKVTVRNCAFEHNLVGLTTWNTADVLITNNTFTQQLKTGIGLQAARKFDVKNSVIEKNQISNTALYPLYGERTDGVYGGIGISVFGKAYTVRQNTVENTGWTGIYLKDQGNHVIENNLVRKSLLLLNDGGAISIGSDANTIRGNFLLETVGNVDESNGCGSTNKTPCMHHPSYGMGLGADSKFKNNVIEGNTVANNQHQGIRLNAFVNTSVRNNTLYNNHKNQIVIEDKKGSSRNNVIAGNIIYALGPDQMGVQLTGKGNHGTFEDNYYCNPYSEVLLIRDNKRYALGHWQKAFPKYDKTSKSCGHHFDEYTVTNVGNPLLKNPTFDVDVSDWKGTGSSTISHDTSQAAMEGGALKSVYKGSKNANVMPNSFELVANQLYRLQFSVIGNGFGNLQMRINHAEPKASWKILQERFFAYDRHRKDYEAFFTMPMTTAFGKILFVTKKIDDKTYWLDNVTFAPVEATLNDATQQSVLFINPSAEPKTIALKNVSYLDLKGKSVTGSTTLAPFTSQILVSSESKPVSEKPVSEKPVSEKPVSEKPQAPTLSVAQSGTKVTLSWNPVSGANAYRLYYAPYPDASEVGNMDMGSETQLSLELFSGMAFYVAVSALNAVGESDYSNIEYFIIP